MGKKSGKVGSRRNQYSLFDQIELQHAPRVLVVEFFYWPFLAFGLNDPDLLAVIADKGVVKALSPRAKKEGIVVGDRARTALSVAPDLMVISSDLIDHGKPQPQSHKYRPPPALLQPPLHLSHQNQEGEPLFSQANE